MSGASHVEGLILCERSTLWLYFFSQIYYHDNIFHLSTQFENVICLFQASAEQPRDE